MVIICSGANDCRGKERRREKRYVVKTKSGNLLEFIV